MLDAGTGKGTRPGRRVVAPDALEDAIDRLTAKIHRGAGQSHSQRRKRLLRLSRHNTFSSQFNAEIESAASCVSDEDFMEAVTAFSERRQAKIRSPVLRERIPRGYRRVMT